MEPKDWSWLAKVGSVVGIVAIVAGAIWRVAANTSAIDTLNPNAIKTARDNALVEIKHATAAALGSLAEADQRAAAIPVGGIVPFYGDAAALPLNWRICDGQPLDDARYRRSPLFGMNLPNLVGRYVKGAMTSDEVGGEGGREQFRLPNHDHEYLDSARRGQSRQISVRVSSGGAEINNTHLHENGKKRWTNRIGGRDIPLDPLHTKLHYIIKVCAQLSDRTGELVCN